MKNIIWLLIPLFMFSCQNDGTKTAQIEVKTNVDAPEDFNWEIDRFDDVRVLRYQIPGFGKLSLEQKKFVYYLTEAGLSGRDIMYAMNYRHNLEIKKVIEKIVASYDEDKSTEEWKYFMEYAKHFWFASGIHHHYSMDKFVPKFSREYFFQIMKIANTKMSEEALAAIFDPHKDNKKVNLDESKDLLIGSAVNFYAPDISAKEAEAYYAKIKDKNPDKPLSHGLNSKMIRNPDGTIGEEVYSINGLYGSAIKEIVGWLEKASTVTENEQQKKALDLLIDYYKTGDLKTWDAYNVAWVSATDGDVDYINSFIEVYNDPLGYKGSYESIVEIKDFDASARMAVLAENVQWFEDNSTIRDEHKKPNVVGVSYKVVSVAGESGDASPATPIGVNLPNSNWIRSTHGSKSVSLGNIIHAYDKASGSGFLAEFANDDEEIRIAKKYGDLADKMGTALHEVIGHASGKINKGVGTPKQTLKNYASTLEEARADIVDLYFIMDKKMEEIGLLPSSDVGIAEYDGYIRNGMMTQLRRIEKGKIIEESHMRNRQLISAWAFEHGKKDNVIEKIKRDGKTYFNITDYKKLRVLFGELLKELQRIKSEGDYAAGKALVEDYGVQVDQAIHAEVLQRCLKLDIPAYSGFANPVLVPVTNDSGEITNIVIEFPLSFKGQMMEYAKKYSFL